jgi:hypothetical protein
LRRFVTPLLVAGILLLGVLAAADALRGDGESKISTRARPAATSTRPLTLRETLAAQRIAGILVYSDADCRLHSLVLPTLLDQVTRSDRGGPVRFCRFSDAGGRFTGPGVVESPGGGEVASCDSGRITVRDSSSRKALRSFAGCAPAWHPNGQLTYARGEEVLEDARVLYSRAELHRIARHHPNVAGLGQGIPFRVRVLGLAWLNRKLLAASLQVDIESVEPQYFVVLLDGDRILALDAPFGRPARKLVVSPGGAFVAEDNGTLLSRQGRSYDRLEGIPPPRAVVFSPDDGWLAMATGTSVYLVGTPRNLGRVIRLPIPAQDLVWEPAGAGATDTSTTVR